MIFYYCFDKVPIDQQHLRLDTVEDADQVTVNILDINTPRVSYSKDNSVSLFPQGETQRGVGSSVRGDLHEPELLVTRGQGRPHDLLAEKSDWQHHSFLQDGR